MTWQWPSVDDLVIRYADGHREFRSVMLSLRKGSKAWIGLWKNFGAQHSAPDFSRCDSFSIIVETETAASRLVQIIGQALSLQLIGQNSCSCSTNAQCETVDDIVGVLGAEQKTFDVLRRSMIIFLSNRQVEREVALKKLAEDQQAQQLLFAVLRDLVGGDANALHRLTELHATENDWHLADTIATLDSVACRALGRLCSQYRWKI